MYFIIAKDKFLEYLEIDQNKSLKTINNYSHYLDRLTDFAGEDIMVENIDYNLIRSWRKWLLRLGSYNSNQLKANTLNYHLIALRSFLKFCARNNIEALPADKIELAKTNRQEISFLSEEEVDKIINYPKKDTLIELRDKAILELLFSSGLRVSELTSLNIDHINLKRREFTVRGKGQKDRPIFISVEAAQAIQNYLAKRTDNLPSLFINSSTNSSATQSGNYKRLTPRSIQRLVSKYAKLAGITKKVTPHSLRHSFATDLLMNGADLRSVQALLGHSNISTTQIYTHITDYHLKDVHEKFHHKNQTKT